MNEIELNKYNESIPYAEGKIYWKENKYYTSALWERLKKEGWEMKTTKNFIEVHDNEGFKVIDTIGVFNALKELSKLMY